MGHLQEPDGTVFPSDGHDPPARVEREGGDGAGKLAGLPDRPEQGCIPQADDPAFGPGGEDPAVRRDSQALHFRPLGRQVEATFRLGVPDVEPPGPPPRDDRPAVGSQGDHPDRRVLMQLGLDGIFSSPRPSGGPAGLGRRWPASARRS